MRRRGERSRYQLEWFRPEDVVVDTATPTWVDVLGNAAPPPLLNRLPSPSAVLEGSARPDFHRGPAFRDLRPGGHVAKALGI